MNGWQIRQCRKKMKLTIAELSRQIGVSRGHISKIENFKYIASPKTLKLITDFFEKNKVKPYKTEKRVEPKNYSFTGLSIKREKELGLIQGVGEPFKY